VHGRVGGLDGDDHTGRALGSRGSEKGKNVPSATPDGGDVAPVRW